MGVYMANEKTNRAGRQRTYFAHRVLRGRDLTLRGTIPGTPRDGQV